MFSEKDVLGVWGLRSGTILRWGQGFDQPLLFIQILCEYISPGTSSNLQLPRTVCATTPIISIHLVSSRGVKITLGRFYGTLYQFHLKFILSVRLNLIFLSMTAILIQQSCRFSHVTPEINPKN